MKGLKCFLFFLFVSFCSFFFISTPVQALRESSNITYWVSEGGVWLEPGNTKYPFNLTIESFGGNNFQISPSRGINEQSGTQTQRENVWLVRTWFRLPRSIQNALGARFTVYGIFYPNSILDGGWQCGDNTGLNSSITGNGVVARLEEVHCTEVRDSQGLQALRLYSTFTLSPLYGSTFTDNPELYITWNSTSREYGIFNFDGYLITSGLSDSSSGLYMASHLDIDDLTLFTDPNTGVLNQQLDVQIDINNNLDEVNDNLNTIDNSINSQTTILNNSIESLRDSQDQANNDAQARWEADKEEEAEREEAIQDSADEMSGVFNFNIRNPFTAFLALFTDGGSCVSIPIIAGMVHSENTLYCPWFSAQTRNILTPVITLVASVLLIGFVVGWLNSGDSNGSITIKGGIKNK